MQSLLSDSRIPALVLLSALAAFAGCKAKLSRSGGDGGTSAAGLSRPDLDVAEYLTRNAHNLPLPSGEKIIALDQLVGRLDVKRQGERATVRGRARVFVRTAAGDDVQRMHPLRCELRQVNRVGGKAWSVQSCHLGAARVNRQTGPRDTGRAGPLGVPACDAMLRFMDCYLGKLPPATQQAARKAYRQMRESYRKMMANPATRKSAEKGCRMSLEAMRKSIVKMPQFAGCLRSLE